MNRIRNSATTALLALALTGVLPDVGHAQDGGQRPRTEPASASEHGKERGGRVGPRQLMSPEEKLIRNAYVKLMRYQSAALDELAATSKKESQPDDYLRFELRDIHTGPIDEISEQPLSEFVTPPAGDIVTVKPNHRVWGNGPAHAYYEAEWAGASDAQQTGESATVEETLRSGGEKLLGVEKYTIYQVSVRLGGKQRIYRAMALHHGKSETGKESSEIIDNITSEINTVLGEESPRVRSPWKTYVKTSLYLAIAREIRDKQQAGLPLISVDAPIGYLPGDDLNPATEAGDMVLAVVCATVEITNISPGILNVSTGDAASAHTLTVDFTPAGTSASISFQATFAANYGGSSQASLTIPTVTGTSPVTSTVKAGGVDSSGAFSVQPAADGNLSPKETRVIVPPQVLLKMMNKEAGGLNNPAPSMPLLGWSMRNRFNDSAYFQGQTNYAAAISASATQSNLAIGKQPELDAAAGVFDGFFDPSSGCQGFWSPTDSQWVTIDQALKHPTTTLPTGVGEPFCYNGKCKLTQYVYFPSVGFNNRPGRQNAPAFVFVRKRNVGDIAVVQVN